MGTVTFDDPAMKPEFDSGASLESLRAKYGPGKIHVEHEPRDIEEMGTDAPDIEDVDALVASRRAGGPSLPAQDWSSAREAARTREAPPPSLPPGGEQVYTQPRSYWSKAGEALPGIKMPGSPRILSSDWETARARARMEQEARDPLSGGPLLIKKPADIGREAETTFNTWYTRNLPLGLYRAGKGVLEVPAMVAGGAGLPLYQWATERDPLKQEAIAERLKKSATEAAEGFIQPFTHPVETFVEDPVQAALGWSLPFTGGASVLGKVGRAGQAGRLGALSRPAAALGKAAPVLRRAAGEIASAPVRAMALPHMPGSYPYRIARAIAGMEKAPEALKAGARFILKPSDIIKTMPAKIQEIMGRGPATAERTAALGSVRGFLAEPGELLSPMGGQMVPAPLAIGEAAHLVPEALKARWVEEAARGPRTAKAAAAAQNAKQLTAQARLKINEALDAVKTEAREGLPEAAKGPIATSHIQARAAVQNAVQAVRFARQAGKEAERAASLQTEAAAGKAGQFAEAHTAASRTALSEARAAIKTTEVQAVEVLRTGIARLRALGEDVRPLLRQVVPLARKAEREAAIARQGALTGGALVRQRLLADPTRGAAAIETLESQGIRAVGKEGTPEFGYEAIPRPPPPPAGVTIKGGQGVKADPRLVAAMNQHLAPLRRNIDAVTKELTDLGYAGADSAEILGPRLGSYLKRIYDEKVVKEKFPEVYAKWQAEKKANAKLPPDQRLDQNHLMRRVWGDLPYATMRELGLIDDFARIGFETVDDLVTLRDRLRLTDEMKTYSDTLDPALKTVTLPKEVTTRGYPRYGKMAGETTTPEVASALRAFSDLMGDVSQTTTPIGRAYVGALGLWKKAMLSPALAWATYLRNGLSFVVAQSEMAGNPILQGRGLKAWAEMRNQWRAGGGPAVDEFVLAGGAGKGLAGSREMKLIAGRFAPVPTVTEWMRSLPEMLGRGRGAGERVAAAERFLLDDPLKSYGFADDFFRSIQFKMVRDMQREHATAPPIKRAKMGRGLTTQWGVDAPRILMGGAQEALEMAHKATLNYADVSRLGQGIAKYLSPFHRFTYLSTEQIINWFQQHPLKVAMLRTADDFYNRMFARFMLEMEPEDLRKQLAALPPYLEAAMPIRKNPDGTLSVVSLGYVLPFGSFGSPRRHYQAGAPAIESAYFSNPLARPASMAYSAMSGGPVFDPWRQRPVLPASAGALDKAGAVGTVLRQQVTPPLLRTAGKALDALTGKASPYTGEVPPLSMTALGYATGLKPEVVTPSKQRQMAHGEFERAIREQRQMKAALKWQKGMSPADRLAAVRKINKRIREIQDERRIRQREGR